MALVDVYEMRMYGTVLNEPWNLVFHLLRSGSGIDAETIQAAAASTLIGSFKPAVTADVALLGFAVKSLGNPLDFFEATTNQIGTLGSSNTISPFAVCTIRFARGRTDMHHGYKRIPGIAEDYVADGVISGQQLTNMDALAADIISNWEDSGNPGTTVCNYIVVKRVLDGGVYRLPQTDGELVYYQPTQYAVNANMSTQNSRKF